MKRILIASFTVICGLAVLFFLRTKKNSKPQFNSAISVSENSKTVPHDLMFMQRAYPKGNIKSEALSEAIDWKKTINKKNSSVAGIWEFVGPDNVGGHISDIEYTSHSSPKIYVGASSGGVFRSDDNGASWQAIFDDQANLGIGDIEISKTDNNLIFVGTGEVHPIINAYDGNGIYKSTDGGDSWQSIGLQNVGNISKVIVDRFDNNRIFVGAMGRVYKKDFNRGLYRTTDGGDTWQQVLFISDKTGVVDMAVHPTNNNILYAATWEKERTPENRVYGGATSGIYRTTDGGDTWVELVVGLPFDPAKKGRIGIDISRSNPEVLYASYADAEGNLHAVYRTNNGGDTWIEVNSDQLTQTTFHFWFGGMFVDPYDENTVYYGGLNLQKSTNGGLTWEHAFKWVHADHHAMAFHPTNTNEILLGNDGGLYKSLDSGDTSDTKFENLPITQFYRIYVDPQDDHRIYGGSQDNGTIRTVTGESSDWSFVWGADGMQSLVHKDNSNVIFATIQRGGILKSTNNAAQGSFSSSMNGIDPNDRNNWDSPLVFDPNNNDILYFGTNKIYKSVDIGDNWEVISNDLTNGPGSGNLSFGTITTIDVSPLDTNIIYVGTDDGNVWRTLDGGVNWSDISFPLPNRWVTKIKASPNELNKVYITFSGYRFGEDKGHVYSSVNNGASWDDISSNLPDLPINDIEIDEFNNLFLATDFGVLASGNNGQGWVPFGENMPSVVVTDLYIDIRTKYLYAGTFGRSIYHMDIGNNVLSIDDVVLNQNKFVMFPNPAKDEISIILDRFFEEKKVRVYNQLGQLQKTLIVSQKESRFDISDLTPGFYILKVGDKSANTIKFVKK